jgi:hypothetical protein
MSGNGPWVGHNAVYQRRSRTGPPEPPTKATMRGGKVSAFAPRKPYKQSRLRSREGGRPKSPSVWDVIQVARAIRPPVPKKVEITIPASRREIRPVDWVYRGAACSFGAKFVPATSVITLRTAGRSDIRRR